MLCLSFYEWRCIDAGKQMILAPFLGRTSRDSAPGRFADFLFAPKHEKADVLLTTNMGPVRRVTRWRFAPAHGTHPCLRRTWALSLYRLYTSYLATLGLL